VGGHAPLDQTNLTCGQDASSEVVEEASKRGEQNQTRGGRPHQAAGGSPSRRVSSIVAEPPKYLGPPAPVIVLRTSDGDAEDPPTLEVLMQNWSANTKG